MMVRTSIDIAASPEDVFHALTDPHELAAWLGGVDDYGTSVWNDDPAPGTAWQSPAIGPDGTVGAIRGELLLVDAPRRLVTTWHASWDYFARTLVRYELAPVQVDGAPGTRVTVIHSAPAPVTMHVSRFDAVRETAWSTMLARLARLMNERLTV